MLPVTAIDLGGMFCRVTYSLLHHLQLASQADDKAAIIMAEKVMIKQDLKMAVFWCHTAFVEFLLCY